MVKLVTSPKSKKKRRRITPFMTRAHFEALGPLVNLQQASALLGLSTRGLRLLRRHDRDFPAIAVFGRGSLRLWRDQVLKYAARKFAAE